jgi:hypothetical protein
MDSESDLPRPAGDDDNLKRLREQALARLEREERERLPMPVYGAPPLDRGERERLPAPVYGGPPPDGPPKAMRRWILLATAVALAVIAWFMAKYRIWPLRPPAPVYGGPPLPPPGLLLIGRWITRVLG